MTHKKPRLSRLLRDILLVNLLPVALIFAALFYLDQYQQGLLSAEVSALREQARIYASAVAQTAVQENTSGATINPDLAQPLLYQLTEPSPNAQALIYGPDGELIANSRVHPGPGGAIVTEPLAAPPPQGFFPRAISFIYDQLLGSVAGPVDETGLVGSGAGQNPATLGWQPDARQALQLTSAGPDQEAPPFVRRDKQGQLLITVAEPIQRSQQSVGTVLLTREAAEVDSAVLAVRISILGLFALALGLTVIVSFYLARTIASPILRLAGAAALMREGRARTQALPESITERNDEIGTLARALDGSAKALWARMDAIEQFAADVSHEIKNPLSSIRSAIETLSRVEDPARAARLLAIITQDVARLDRLITDISDSSRLDSELSRSKMDIVDMARILATLAEIHDATRKEGGPYVVVDAPAVGLFVRGAENRLVQVLRNLIGNAISFSPPNGKIWLRGRETGGMVELAVEDEGPGIPDAKLDGIFDRFYSERPQSEQFGSHSGLGLSISRQIVEAHLGRISAENRRNEEGAIIGARFVIRLPKAEG
ncbi:ATP-binding protein [Acidocella sp.]|uniref:ATP-binding protein n=1 Tax=Acidocella sp. TaxID=50710 RepID=UPI0026175BD2|nr:stimulus-sensing domain-containing protein [Acidocella sp.]MDD2794867.1 stimulus-sensing domain-containing protein [Acidocella sp.]